eukprot:TRINITY_DN13949_c0_g2_i1.p1 TRINITY_DN13949_c0_g2~~TRINITY_DN13949_c0_g2_i1.p1  ORF type:complete len:520 (-),score=112.70 TRINITY_DN13949_c0_g2_i1:46-1605(-)
MGNAVGATCATDADEKDDSVTDNLRTVHDGDFLNERNGSKSGRRSSEKAAPEDLTMELLVHRIERDLSTFAVQYRDARTTVSQDGPEAAEKFPPHRLKAIDDSLYRIAAELKRLERRTAVPGVAREGNVFLGMRKKRFKSLKAVVHKVMAEIRVARLLSRWTAAGQDEKDKLPAHLSSQMDTDFSQLNSNMMIETWDGVNVLELDKTSTDPLVQVFMAVWNYRKMNALCKTSKHLVMEYIGELESKYKANPYHNRAHAAEVTLMSYQFFANLSTLKNFQGYFEQIDLLVILVAAAIHDVGHPATNNDFMVKTKSDLALRYHDTAVLENFHLATAFELMRDRNIPLLDHYLPSPPVTSLRRRIVEIVLGTDMAVHKSKVEEMVMVAKRNSNRQDIDKRQLEQYLVHTADIGHPLRPVEQHKEWAERVTEEFFAQGDREKELGFTPISLFDREIAPGMGKGQLGFLKFVVQAGWDPLCTLMEKKSKMAQLYLNRNLKAWEALAAEEEAAAAAAAAGTDSSG